jgi:Fe-S cluster assembly iron-binding protein IscA
LALDEPTEDDVVEEVNGIKVAFDKHIHGQTGGMALEYQETPQGGGLVLKGNESDCC